MRIVGGTHKGRPLQAPKGRDTRPTSDRARESLFNVLAHGVGLDLDGAKVADVFAGTGALGLEALSRGAAHATFVDLSPLALKTCRANAAALGELKNAAFLKLDARRLPHPARVVPVPLDLVFLDPPYGEDLVAPALLGLLHKGWLADDAHAVVEVGAQETFDPPRGWLALDDRVQSAARILVLRRE